MSADAVRPAGESLGDAAVAAEPQYAPPGHSFRSITDRISSIAFPSPINRVIRWVPPPPGIMPSLISG